MSILVFTKLIWCNPNEFYSGIKILFGIESFRFLSPQHNVLSQWIMIVKKISIIILCLWNYDLFQMYCMHVWMNSYSLLLFIVLFLLSVFQDFFSCFQLSRRRTIVWEFLFCFGIHVCVYFHSRLAYLRVNFSWLYQGQRHRLLATFLFFSSYKIK